MRPVDDWRAFSLPNIIVQQGQVSTLPSLWVPSPLLGGAKLPALLHFEVATDGGLTSPQVLNAYDAQRAEDILPDELQQISYRQKLDELRLKEFYWLGNKPAFARGFFVKPTCGDILKRKF